MLVYGVVPVGAIAGGWLGDTIGLRATLAVGTGGLLTTSLFLILSPVRHARDVSDCKPTQHADPA